MGRGSKENGSYTFCVGPSYNCIYRLERHHFAAVVAALNQIFGKEWRFGLVTDGIEVLEWPGREFGMYKMFNLKPLKNGTIHWPLLPEGDSWRKSTKVVVDNLEFASTLSAFYGAPCWSLGEIEKWNKAWARVGVTVQRDTMYPTSKYISYDYNVGVTEKKKTELSGTPVKKRFRRARSSSLYTVKRVKLRFI